MIHVATAPWAHLIFDLAAWGSAALLGVLLRRSWLKGRSLAAVPKLDGGYFLALVGGAIPGAWLAGSVVSLQGSHPALSHSVVGALAGAIVGVEIYKARRGIAASTGSTFVGPFALGVVIGRFGCFFSGITDGTYGTPTALPWGVDLGDGVSRHPVQLYESAAMTVFLTIYLLGLSRGREWALRRGFYVMCFWYGGQRFVWEFLKPYPALIGPFNLFHVVCGGLVAYGWIYYRQDRRREFAQRRALPFPRPDNQPV